MVLSYSFFNSSNRVGVGHQRTAMWTYRSVSSVKWAFVPLLVLLNLLGYTNSVIAQCADCPAGATLVTTSQSITLTASSNRYCVSGAGVVVGFTGSSATLLIVYVCDGATANLDGLSGSNSVFLRASGAGSKITTTNISGNSFDISAINGGDITLGSVSTNCFAAFVGPSSFFTASATSITGNSFSIYNQGTSSFTATDKIATNSVNLFSTNTNWYLCATEVRGNTLKRNSLATVCATGTVSNNLTNAIASYTIAACTSAGAGAAAAFAAGPEICGDGLDNDYNGFVDGADAACSGCILPSAITFTQTPPTCTGTTSNNNGKITLSSVTNGTHYGVSTKGAASYNGPAFASATAISGTPDVETSIPNTGGAYIVRIFSGLSGCYRDQTVTVAAVTCVATPLSASNPAAKTANTGVAVTGDAAAELAPAGGILSYKYTAATNDGACTPVAGATPLAASSNLTVTLATGAYSYTAPAAAGAYYYCIKVCDSKTPTAACVVKTYTLTVASSICTVTPIGVKN